MKNGSMTRGTPDQKSAGRMPMSRVCSMPTVMASATAATMIKPSKRRAVR